MRPTYFTIFLTITVFLLKKESSTSPIDFGQFLLPGKMAILLCEHFLDHAGSKLGYLCEALFSSKLI